MQLIYFAHPYGGNGVNRLKASEILADLQRDYPDKTFVSPVHGICVGLTYEEVPQEIAMKHCINLLAKCDECWTVEGWDESAGCTKEYEYCQKNQVPFKVLRRRYMAIPIGAKEEPTVPKSKEKPTKELPQPKEVAPQPKVKKVVIAKPKPDPKPYRSILYQASK